MGCDWIRRSSFRRTRQRFHIADVASEMSKRNLLTAKGDYVPLKTKEESPP